MMRRYTSEVLISHPLDIMREAGMLETIPTYIRLTMSTMVFWTWCSFYLGLFNFSFGYFDTVRMAQRTIMDSATC